MRGRRRTNRRWDRLLIDALEPRVLMSLAAAGAEFRANTFTVGTQSTPAVAADGDGDFVVAWHSLGQDGDDWGVYAQRYGASGVPLGSEFRVNTYTTSTQSTPSVAVDADGDFVIAWNSYGQDGSGNGIYARRYTAAGTALGGEFRVNTTTSNYQSFPAVAMGATGEFVVAWASHDQDASLTDGVYAQRFAADGAPRGGEFRVNTYTTGSQTLPAIAADADGDFVIAWQSGGQDGSGYGVYAQRYSSGGTARGGEFRVNTVTAAGQQAPDVALDAAGNFVVAWTSYASDPSGDVKAQRFDADGAPRGGEFQPGTSINKQGLPDVASDAAGNFVLSWTSELHDGSGLGVYAQRYTALGQTDGASFRVNTHTTSHQAASAVALDADGDAIVAWQSYGQDSAASYGVYAQRYDESGADAAAPVVAGVLLNGAPVAAYSSNRPSFQQLAVAFSENVSDAGGPGGANSVTNPANWMLTRNGVDLAPQITSIAYGFNFAVGRYEAVLSLSAAHASGNFLLTVRDNVRDIAGNRLDGNLDGTAGENLVLPFGVTQSMRRAGTEWRVNTSTTNGQSRPAVASDAQGNFVVAWTNAAFAAGQTADEIYAQRYNAAGVPQGGEFRVNTFTTGWQMAPAVAMDGDGDFVVVWVSINQATATSAQDVYAQRFNAAGAAQGGEFRVNVVTTGLQLDPAVAMNASGGFVVTWITEGPDGDSFGIANRRFSASGTGQGGEFLVNQYTTGSQSQPAVAMDAAGNTVIAWETADETGHGQEVYAQRYNSAGLGQGTQFRVNENTINHQTAPSVAMDADGDFVIAWTSRYHDGGYDGVYARRFNASGAPQGTEFRANTYTTANQRYPAVDMDAGGGFVVAWESEAQDGDARGIYAQRFSAAGAPLGGEVRVNTFTTDNQEIAAIAVDAEGDFVVAWQSNGQDGASYGVYAQRYGVDQPPTVGMVSDNPDPVTGGNSFTLSASAVADDGAVTAVSFYRETNGQAGLQVGAGGDALVGTATSQFGGFWSVNVSTVGLGAGTYTYWAQASDDAGLTGPPTATTNTVIGGAPSVSASNFLFATLPQRLTFAFTQNVAASLGLNDIVIQQLPGGPIITPSGLSYDPTTNTATVTLAAALPDGRYRATLLAAGITNAGGTPMGGNHIYEFFFLRGDANHDGAVNLQDFNILAANFGGTNRTFSQGDFNYDGSVNLQDFNLLAGRFGVALGPDGSATAARPEGARRLGDMLDDILA